MATGAEAEAQVVELGGDRLDRRQVLVGVALAVDQLLADLGGGQAAVQAGGLEGRVGLEVVLDEIADVGEEGGRWTSMGLRPRAEKLSRQVMPEWSSCIPLRTVSRPSPRQGQLAVGSGRGPGRPEP